MSEKRSSRGSHPSRAVRVQTFAYRLAPAVLCMLIILPTATLGFSRSPDDETIRLAYIDPGAGSFVVQALIAALAGIAVTSRLYWSKIKRMLGIATEDEDDEDSQSDDE